MKILKVLIACEESQAVCKAFRKLGHEAFSCDILECSGGEPQWHIQRDVLNCLGKLPQNNMKGWDLIIAHPPCTYLSYAATRWWNDEGRLQKRLEALNFFAKLWLAKCEYICIENPRGCASPTIAKYSQAIQPYQFGDEESKLTWLWLKNLPELKPTKIVKPKIYGYYKTGKKKGKPIYGNDYCKFSEDRGKIRSKTFPGIAKAMAKQWSEYILSNLSPTSQTKSSNEDFPNGEHNMGLKVPTSSPPKLSPTEITSPNPNIKLNKLKNENSRN